MYYIFSLILIILILILFFLASKLYKWETTGSTTFECGFTSYYFSRFSFSIHYFMVGLIFLFLDLELCFFFPFLVQDWASSNQMILCSIFILALLMGLLYEWNKGELEWKN